MHHNGLTRYLAVLVLPDKWSGPGVLSELPCSLQVSTSYIVTSIGIVHQYVIKEGTPGMLNHLSDITSRTKVELSVELQTKAKFYL